MKRASLSTSNSGVLYGFASLFLALLFIISAGYFFYKIIPSFSVFPFTQENRKQVYLLYSQDTIEYLKQGGYDVEQYKKRFDLIKKFLQKKVEATTVSEKEIPTLPKRSILLAFDVFNFSKKSEEAIMNFLRQGGRMVFNYHFGYFVDGKFQGNRLVEKITGLQALAEVKSKNSIFITPNLLSPISFDFDKLRRFDYILYDKIPLFRSEKAPDAVMSNWGSTMPPFVEGRRLSVQEDGVMWHGDYEKGSWVYFAFPSYTLTDATYEMFDYFVGGAIEFLQNDVTVVKYPYIRYDKVVFVSEDTEYQYQNLAGFSALAHEYKIPVTVFCVAKLALKYPKMTKETAKDSYVEVGSHSLTHTKIVGESEKKMEEETLGSKLILEKLTGEKVVGFRPPREEVDEKLSKFLIDAGYIYTMEKSKGYFYPKEEFEGLITIPRHGTDDYTYLINLDWNSSQILDQIIHETEFLTNLHLLYTLSVHTHLLSYASNIDIIERYFQYLKKHPEITPLQGRKIAELSKLQRMIDVEIHKTNKKIVFSIQNRNKKVVKDFTFRIYYNNIATLENFISEIIGVRVDIVKKGEKFMDIRIDRLQPEAQLAILADYHE